MLWPCGGVGLLKAKGTHLEPLTQNPVLWLRPEAEEIFEYMQEIHRKLARHRR